MKKQNIKNIIKNESGQALITLLVFMVMLVTITSAAVVITLSNSQTTSKYALSEEAYEIAQSGADNAVLRLLRNSSYTGETLTVGNGTVTITVSGTTTKTIISEGVNGNFKRKVQVIGTFSNNIFTITSWQEV